MITGAAPSSTLHDSRLNIIFRSVESDSESSSEVTKLWLRISDTFWNCFSNNFKKFQKVSKNFKKTRNFQKKSVISPFRFCLYAINSVNYPSHISLHFHLANLRDNQRHILKWQKFLILNLCFYLFNCMISNICNIILDLFAFVLIRARDWVISFYIIFLISDNPETGLAYADLACKVNSVVPPHESRRNWLGCNLWKLNKSGELGSRQLA